MPLPNESELRSVVAKIQFRRIRPEDRERILAIAARTWEGHDYLPIVFDRWVADQRGYFGGAFLDGKLVGCGRALRLDKRRGWLEGLRVDPDYHGHGLGRAISHHTVEAAIAMGLEELLFATYFANSGSIAISESAGFRLLAKYTNLELEDLHEPEQPSISEEPGLPKADTAMWNDWFYVPAGTEDRSDFFPGALTLRGEGTTLVLSDNAKYPSCLEISWMDGPAATVSTTCLQHAIAIARRRGRASMHLMLPERFPLEPFKSLGFSFHEREGDVWLYGANASELRLK